MNIIVVDEDEVPDKSNRQKVIAVHTLVALIQRRILPKISLSYLNNVENLWCTLVKAKNRIDFWQKV